MNLRIARATWVCLLLLVSSGSQNVLGHEVPADVTVQTFVVPQDGMLQVLVRVPLTSMRDVEFPLFGPGYVVISEVSDLLPALAQQWLSDYVEFYEDGELLAPLSVRAARISLPSDRSFETPERARAHILSPTLPDETELVLEQALLDVWLETPIQSEQARFSIHAAWAHLGIRTRTVLRFLPPSGGERVFQYEGVPGRVDLEPGFGQAVVRFVALGFWHILEGWDHLLFLACLVIPARKLGNLIRVVSAFTVAHSITLIGAAYGITPQGLWFTPLIETLIALSIVYMALENMLGTALQRRWAYAYGFGLVHGFGFSFLLSDSLQYAGDHIIGSLLAFNVGVELGQLLVLLVLVPVLNLFMARLPAPKMGVIVLSALVAHTAWHWMVERGGDFLQFELPAGELPLGSVLPWVFLAAVAGFGAWSLSVGFRWLDRDRADPAGLPRMG